MGVETNGRLATLLTAAHHEAFNTNYCVVFHHARGLAVVYEKATGEPMTFTAFRKLHGVLGEQWLASWDKPTFHSWAHYLSSQKDLENGARIAAERNLPAKNSYVRGDK